ncbi:MAG: hypothetical protein SVU69_04270 [Pseudomonadota bacterium]|nr:hypothetical protein [Pseudomonadota bacterium]
METAIQDLEIVAQACAASDPSQGVAGLTRTLARCCPQQGFETVLSRGGWYRLGGVVDGHRQRLAESLPAWAEEAADGDLIRLLTLCRRENLYATRLVGRTHYFTAPVGRSADAFMQLEVEELQEVLDRQLSDPDWQPDSLEEFVDPIDYRLLEPEPIGPPRYAFRRLVMAREVIAGMEFDRAGALSRMLTEWDESSAGRAVRFCDHWALAVHESVGADGVTQLSARPLPAHRHENTAWDAGATGAELAKRIHAFDRDAGYPFAWFFHIVAGAGVPQNLGDQIARDHDPINGFSYLPPRDLAVLLRWQDTPYRA